MTPAIAAAQPEPGPQLVPSAIMAPGSRPIVAYSEPPSRPKDPLGAAIGRVAGSTPPAPAERLSTFGLGIASVDVFLSRRPPATGRLAVVKRRRCTMPEHRAMPAHPIHVTDRLSVEEV